MILLVSHAGDDHLAPVQTELGTWLDRAGPRLHRPHRSRERRLQGLLGHPGQLARDAAGRRGRVRAPRPGRGGPVIFQELVPAEVDLRVTVVGERLFAAAVHSQELAYPLDFRLFLDRGPGVRSEPTELPAEVEEGLLRLLKLAGLRYGAVDLRRTPDGRHVSSR